MKLRIIVMYTSIHTIWQHLRYLPVLTFCVLLLTSTNHVYGAVERRYSWIDFKGEKRTVAFTIQASDILESVKEFGVPPADLSPQKLTFNYKINYNSRTSPQEIRRLKEKAKADSERQAKALLNAKQLRIMSRGYTIVGQDKVGVDLSAAWNRNRKRMSSYIKQFKSQVPTQSDVYAHQALAFVQNMQYSKPPDIRAGLSILQFYPPVEALNAGYGDCDTKVILFASLVDNGKGREIIALRGPDHVIAGLECDPGASGNMVNAFGKSFLLCECSAPSWPAGSISNETYNAIKRGEYVLVRLRSNSASSITN